VVITSHPTKDRRLSRHMRCTGSSICGT